MWKSHKCIILLSLLLANIVVIAQVPTNGLIGYWPFNGNANDVSGNGNDGILEGESQNPQLTTDRFGNTNSAYEFGGYYNKNWIRVPNNSTMHLNNQMTVSLWFQQCEFSGMDGWGNYSTTSAGFTIFSKAGDGNAAYPGLWIMEGINSETGILNINSNNCNINSHVATNYAVNTEYRCFDTCEWIHYVTIIDDNIAKIYINGVLYCDTIIEHADYTKANLQDVFIGRMGCNGFVWFPFYGKLDDIAFYNRAITEEEVAQLFDNYYDPHYYDNLIVIDDLIVQKACDGNNGCVQVFPNMENGPFQYALDQPTNFQNSNILNNISEGLHRVYVKSECGLKDTIVDFSCLDIPFPDNIDSANCVFFPTATEWSIAQPIISSESALTVITPVAGDIDNDGQQEILIPSGYSQMNVFRANGTLKSQFNIAGLNGGQAVGTFALGNVKWTTETNKVIIVLLGNNRYLYAYDANGTQLWQSNQQFVSYNGENTPMPTISFADFNHDGWSEIYIGSEFYDAVTGAFLCKATGNKGYAGRTWDTQANPYQTMAHDLCGDPRLELAIGNTVYDVDIQSRTDASLNHVTAIRQLSTSEMIMEDNSTIPFTDGNTTLIDINLDGQLDVLVMNVDQSNRVVYLYVWDVTTESIICSKKITNARKFGFPQIGDIDNDGNPEICFIVGTYDDHNTGSNDLIYALKYNPSNNNGALDIFWTTPHSDNSACTGLTLFDFNQDGYAELVYRDIAQLRIINGSLIHHQSGQPVSQPYDMATFPCCSNTQIEYPIIADVDLDGEAEIIIGGANSMTDYGHLYIFKSETIPWAPARPVWNQYMYNVTNVNKDLTIPQQLFNNATPFTDPDGVVRRPFNNFLQQATTIDQYGRPFYAVPDAAALSADIIPSGSNSTLNITYTNQGDNILNAPYYITVFANEFGGAMMQSLTVDAPLAVGNTVQQSLVFSTYDLCQMPDLNSLVVVINCAGGGIAQNGNLQPECDIENNITQVSVNLQNEPINITETACNQFVWHGETYTQSGQYEITISNPYGCDTTFILNLTISDNYREEDRVSECDSYYWPRTQQWYYQSALDSVVIQSQQGVCDSTFVLDLTLHFSDTLNLEPVTVCEAFEWHGQTYAESGTYTYDTVNQYGCQTQYVLPLTISHSVEHEFSVTSCEPYEWYGTVYDEPGTYTQVLTGSQGCDSIVTLNLMVALSSESSIHGPTTIYPSTDLVPGVYSYYIDSTGIELSNVRWGIDREDWQLIPHGASCDLLCMSDGEGILHVWTEGESCNMDTTIVVNATFFGMGEAESSLRVYPNPTKGKLTVEWEEIQVINVYDLLGQKLMSSEYGKAQSCVLDLSHFRHSMYVLEIVSSTGRVIRPVVLTQ